MEFPIWGTSFILGVFGPAAVSIVFLVAALVTCGLGTINYFALKRSHITNNQVLSRFLIQNCFTIILAPTIITLLLLMMTWFYTSLTNPQTVSTIVHVMMWPLAFEGILIGLQIISALAYHHTSKSNKTSELLFASLIYAVSSWGMIVAIAAVTSFTLTPGRWLVSFSLGDAVLNPTFIPSLIIISAWALILGMSALLCIIHFRHDITLTEKLAIEKLCMKWGWAFIFILPIIPLYFMAVQNPFNQYIYQTSNMIIFLTVMLIIIVSGVLFALSYRRPYNSVGFTGSTTIFALLIIATILINISWAMTKGPYSISQYLYSNGIAVDDLTRLKREGLLNNSPWIVPRGTNIYRVSSEKRGEWIYKALNYERYLGADVRLLKSRLRNLKTREQEAFINNLNYIYPLLPPFAGSPEEIEDLKKYILSSLRGIN